MKSCSKSEWSFLPWNVFFLLLFSTSVFPSSTRLLLSKLSKSLGAKGQTEMQREFEDLSRSKYIFVETHTCYPAISSYSCSLSAFAVSVEKLNCEWQVLDHQQGAWNSFAPPCFLDLLFRSSLICLMDRLRSLLTNPTND